MFGGGSGSDFNCFGNLAHDLADDVLDCGFGESDRAAHHLTYKAIGLSGVGVRGGADPFNDVANLHRIGERVRDIVLYPFRRIAMTGALQPLAYEVRNCAQHLPHALRSHVRQSGRALCEAGNIVHGVIDQLLAGAWGFLDARRRIFPREIFGLVAPM
jgi:hypothetical protein